MFLRTGYCISETSDSHIQSSTVNMWVFMCIFAPSLQTISVWKLGAMQRKS